MKNILAVTVFLLGLLISPLFTNVANAQEINSGNTILMPFFMNTNNTEQKNNIVYKVSKHDIDLLAHLVYGEARGESQEGKVAVAAVILNRTQNPKFADNVQGVIFEKDAFTAVSDGQLNMQPDKTAYEAVYQALKGDDPTGGAVYYWNPRTATSGWVWSRTVIKQIGQHLFAV